MLERPPNALGLEILFGWPALFWMALGGLLKSAWWLVTLPVRCVGWTVRR